MNAGSNSEKYQSENCQEVGLEEVPGLGNVKMGHIE